MDVSRVMSSSPEVLENILSNPGIQAGQLSITGKLTTEEYALKEQCDWLFII